MMPRFPFCRWIANVVASLLSLFLWLAPLGAASVDAQARSDKRVVKDPETVATRSVATAFLEQMLVRHDVTTAYERFADPNFIQHNPEIGNGVAAHAAFFAAKSKASGDTSQWININDLILVDHDLFALYHHAFTGPADPGRVFVDIWRVSAGKIVEHWDVIAAMPMQASAAVREICGRSATYRDAQRLGDTLAHPTCGFPDADTKPAMSVRVVAAYAHALKSGNVRAAVSHWLTADYRQHSSQIPGGRKGTLEYLLNEFGKGPAAAPKIGPIRTIAEGDLVLQHRLTTYADGSRTANIDIFRVTNGRISEHWDLKQPAPNHSVNGHAMW